MAKRSHTIREDDPYYPHLEQWLKVALAPIYEEEGLPAYVLALLASDGDEIDPKESCREKMLDFLGENTNDFVNELFRVIKDGSYKTVALPQIKRTPSLRSDHEESIDARDGSFSRRRRGSSSDEDNGNDEDNEDNEEGGFKRRRHSNETGASDYHNHNSSPRGGKFMDRAMPSRDEQESSRGRQQRPPPPHHQHNLPGYGPSSYRPNMGHHPLHPGSNFGGGFPGFGFGGHAMNNFMGGYGMGPNGMGMMMPPPFMFDAAQQHMMFGMSGGGPFPPHMQHLQQPPRSQNQGPRPPAPRQEGQEAPPRIREPLPAPAPIGFNPEMLENDYKGVINPDAPVFSAYDRDELPPVPEPDRCTLRCTGVPTKVEEKEILAHFQTFGRVICVRRLASAPAGGAAMNAVSATGEERKTYNEFLFQFETRADALKCVGSPKSVLDNRFIRIHMAPYNLIPLSEVPTYIAEGRDAAINGIRIAGPDGAGDHANLNSPRASNPVKEKAAAALKQKYEDLLALRQSQEAIFKKKESLFQKQIEEYRNLISKISALEDSEKNRSLIEGIESKLLDVQSKLRALHDEKNKTTAASLSSSAPPSVTAQGSSGGFRGRGRGGRFAFDASRGGRGGGRARGNRGGNMSLDTRPKSLLISNAPEGFDKQAAAHFGRFGQVLSVKPSGAGDGGLVIEFARRSEAELAKARGSYEGNVVLSIAWNEEKEIGGKSDPGVVDAEGAGEGTMDQTEG